MMKSVSIPSNGSIQFLLRSNGTEIISRKSQSPQTGQFNSYISRAFRIPIEVLESQSPQTGQFNSYPNKKVSKAILQKSKSQSPQTGQFNSYRRNKMSYANAESVSIPSNGSIQFLQR